MINQHAAAQYYSDFIMDVIEHEKTSQPLVVVNRSEDEQIFSLIFSLVKTVTWSEIAEVSIGFAIIYLMIILAGIYA